MKQTIKRVLAVFVAALLATMGPVGALSEGIVPGAEALVSGDTVLGADSLVSGDAVPGAEALASGDTVPGEEEPVVSENVEPPAAEVMLELGGEEGEVSDETSDNVSMPFEQVVTLGDAVVTVTAAAGIVPEGATLRGEMFDSESAARAVEAAIGEGVYVHRSYRLEFVDGENSVILPDFGRGAVAVRVEGLELPDGTRVAVYDESVNGAYEIEAQVNEGDLAFELANVGVYDIFTVQPTTTTQEEAPAEDTTEAQTVEQSAEGQPEEQSDDGEPEEQSDDGQPEEQSAEGQPEEQSAEGQPEEAEEPEVTAQAVSVVFDVVPEAAVVAVRPAEDGEAIPAEADGSFLLLPGEYVYSAGATGYVSIEDMPFTVTGEEQPLLLSVALDAIPEEIPEPVAFEQSMTVNGVVVTVKAEPGVFPANAELSVKRVPTYKARQAEAAIEEVRDEDQNVAVSYTFDIKVIDPQTRQELQPAEGQKVSVSFSHETVANGNLETSVYHIDDSGAAEKLDVTQEDAVTATVETEGFSLYTVEFTYQDLKYTLGDSSVALSAILTELGLTGDVTAVDVSNTGLFSASNESGEWVVTAHQAFPTDEWMKFTIGDVAYEITVKAVGTINFSWYRYEPFVGWDWVEGMGPNGEREAGHYEVRAISFVEGEATATYSDWKELYYYDTNYSLGEIIEKQGPGTYGIEVKAYDGDKNLIAWGASSLKTFHKVTFQIVTLDERGEQLEGKRGGNVSVDLTDDSNVGRFSEDTTRYFAESMSATLSMNADTGFAIESLVVNDETKTAPYSFTLSQDIAIVATFKQDTTRVPSTLTLDEGHEELAEQIAAKMNEIDTLYAATAEGNVVHFSVLKAQTRDYAVFGVHDVLSRLGIERYNSECLLCLRKDYTSYLEWEQDMGYVSGTSEPMPDEFNLYLIWFKPITEVNVTVASPVCGTVVSRTDLDNGATLQTNAPVVTVAEDTVLMLGSRWTVPSDNIYYNPDFEGTIKGGTAYRASFGLDAKFGYKFDSGVQIIANGEVIQYYGGNGYALSVMAVHEWNGTTCSGCNSERISITFDKGDAQASGTMDPVYLARGESYTLPTSGFTAPDGKALREWSMKTGNDEAVSKHPNDAIEVTADTTLTAVWDTAYSVAIAEGIENGTVRLSTAQDKFCAGNTVYIAAMPDRGYDIDTVSYNDGSDHEITPADGVYGFTMPDRNVTVSATFSRMTYIDFDGNGNRKETPGTVPEVYTSLDASVNSWQGGWYVLDSDVEIPFAINVNGDVHLLLKDGKTLTAPYIIVEPSGSLTIYSQEKDTGALVADGSFMFASGIGNAPGGSCGAITINGGQITANGSGDCAGIGGGEGDGRATVTINRGTVTARGGENGAGIFGGNITINGGAVNATGGQAGIDGNLTVGFGGSGDFLKASSYNGTATVKEGCSISDGTTTYASGSISDLSALAGKTLRKVDAYIVSFAADGGSGNMKSVGVAAGGEYTLPDCGFTAPEGWAFVGWSVKIGSAAAVSKQPAESIDVTADTIVTAVWKIASYTVAIDPNIEHGTVELSTDTNLFQPSEPVRLKVTPAAGYAIGTVSYNDGSDHPIEPVDGVYTFIMPDGNVIVSATWLEIPEVTYLITIPDELDFGALTVPEDGIEPVYAEASFTVTAEAILGLENTRFRMNVYVSPEAGKTDFAIVNKADPDVGFTYEIKDLDEGAPLCGFKAAGSYTGTARLDQRQLRHYSMPQIVGEYSGQMVFYSCVEIEGNED